VVIALGGSGGKADGRIHLIGKLACKCVIAFDIPAPPSVFGYDVVFDGYGLWRSFGRHQAAFGSGLLRTRDAGCLPA
jgi:hypothetical protein